MLPLPGQVEGLRKSLFHPGEEEEQMGQTELLVVCLLMGFYCSRNSK